MLPKDVINLGNAARDAKSLAEIKRGFADVFSLSRLRCRQKKALSASHGEMDPSLEDIIQAFEIDGRQLKQLSNSFQYDSVFEQELRKSYLRLRITRLCYGKHGDQPACVMVLSPSFHSHDRKRHRFRSAELLVEFVRASPTDLEVLKIAPTLVLGKAVEGEKKSQWSLGYERAL